LTKENTELQKLIPQKALESWNLLLEIFQQMLAESVTPSQMISILYQNFYRDVMFSSFENALSVIQIFVILKNFQLITKNWMRF